jgi:carboxypeptidase C (cathepsin A)
MIFLSQPLGVGLSYENVSSYTAVEPKLRGFDNATKTDTTYLAAVVAWRAVQSIFAALPEMNPRVVSKEFHLWTER